MIRLFALLFCLFLGACTVPVIPVGIVTMAKFADNDPVAFRGGGPARYPVQGIDVSRFQRSILWHKARANGVNFAFIKATEGGDRRDVMFDDHWRAAAKAGVARGAYHFYYFCTSPEDQARWFIRNVPRKAGDLPPVLDMEWNPLSPTCAHRRPPGAVVRNEMRRYLEIVTAHYGQRPIIYTTPRFFRENGLDKVKGYEFWLRSTAETPQEAYPGQSWRFWQYTATGVVPGASGEIDLNVFRGSAEDWAAWLARRRQ